MSSSSSLLPLVVFIAALLLGASNSLTTPPSPSPVQQQHQQHSHQSTIIKHRNDGNNIITMASTSSSSFSQNPSAIPTSSSSPSPSPLLVLIRHGRSIENEKMEQPGSGWGDATFRDDLEARDSPLSALGRQQAKQVSTELEQTFSNNKDDYHIHVVSSPLTRSLQTMQLGVLPWLQQQQQSLEQGGGDEEAEPVHITALPLCTERIYTAADYGRPARQLQEEFPMVDFSSCPKDDSIPWWWEPQQQQSNEVDNTYPEWRPHGQGQWYAVPGEPWPVFEQRMKQLQQWIHQQFLRYNNEIHDNQNGDNLSTTAPTAGQSDSDGDACSSTTSAATSKTTTDAVTRSHQHRRPLLLIMVTHWGVIRYLTGGKEVGNCHVLTMPLEEILERSTQVVSPGL